MSCMRSEAQSSVDINMMIQLPICRMFRTYQSRSMVPHNLRPEETTHRQTWPTRPGPDGQQLTQRGLASSCLGQVHDCRLGRQFLVQVR